MATLWGGVEHPSDSAIASADKLKCIAVTAADWQGFLPGYKTAIKKGIAIGNTPGCNTYAVAEYTLAVILSMVRDLPSLMNTGDLSFKTTNSMQDLSVGVVGAGRIGETMINMLHGLGVRNISYYNRTRKPELESRYGIEFKSLDQICSQSDVITNHTATPAGEVFTKKHISLMKPGTILVNNGGHGTVNEEALKPRLLKGDVRYAQDEPSEILKDVPISNFYHSNGPSAFNTYSSLNSMSDTVVDFVIDVLAHDDKSKSVA